MKANEHMMDLLGIRNTAVLHASDLGTFAHVVVASLLFGAALQALYSLYFSDNEPQDASLARSLVLITPALTTIFWMVQSSLFLSIGLLGSVSLVRFRAPIKRAEDIAFLLISVGISMALAIGMAVVALVLLTLILGYALVRRLPFVLSRKKNTALITFNTRQPIDTSEIASKLSSIPVENRFVSSRVYDGVKSYVFSATKVTQARHDLITKTLMMLDEQSHINIFYPSERLRA